MGDVGFSNSVSDSCGREPPVTSVNNVAYFIKSDGDLGIGYYVYYDSYGYIRRARTTSSMRGSYGRMAVSTATALSADIPTDKIAAHGLLHLCVYRVPGWCRLRRQPHQCLVFLRARKSPDTHTHNQYYAHFIYPNGVVTSGFNDYLYIDSSYGVYPHKFKYHYREINSRLRHLWKERRE